MRCNVFGSRKTAGCVVLVLWLAWPAGAGAATPVEPGACYARTYDGAHLKAHPRQRVTRIVLGPSAEPDPLYETTLRMGFSLRGSPEVYEGTALCRGSRCDIEGDGGAFALARTERGLRLMVGERLELEGATGFSKDLARSDDRVFLLDRAGPAACR